MDPVDALNRVFPNEDVFIEKFDSIHASAQECQQHLSWQLSHRPDISPKQKSAVNAPSELSKLVADTSKIQKMGEETLEKVKNVTHEIKRLDRTKENLTTSMRMLRQLRMLTNLYIQLDSLLKERRYEDMAGSVSAASDLIEYFRPFRPLPQISKISHEIGEMEQKIYSQIEDDFKTSIASDLGDKSNGNGNASASPNSVSLPSSALRAACNVLDSLDAAHGKSVSRTKLIQWYTHSMLAEYTSIFSPEDEAGSLENVNRRFTFLKNKILLRYMGFHTNFFPLEWPVRRELLTAALESTAKDLVSQVSKLRSTDGDQVQLLLSTLHESLEFEKFSKSEAVLTQQLVPYLKLWVEFQDRQLHQRIITYSRMLLPPEEHDDVLPSSKELINVYRALLQQLSKLKHEEKIVQLLSEVLAVRLGQYGTQVLMAYLPQAVRSHRDVIIAGKIDATAEYIINTTLQLQKNISSQLTDPEPTEEMFDRVALSKYRKVSVKVEECLIQYTQRILEPLWIEYAQQYSALHGRDIDVSRVSPYTTKLVSHLESTLTSMFQAVPSASIIYGVGTHVIDMVCVGFLTMAMARVSKPLSESQVEQMLLDLGAIRSQCLIKMADFAPVEVKEKKGAARLERLPQRVVEKLAQAEAILKVLMTPSEPMETFVRNYHLLVKDRATLNFRKILDVKGVRYHPRAIDKFKLMASQEPHLVAENPLLRQIPTVPPPQQFSNSESSYLNGGSPTANSQNAGGSSTTGFGITNIKKIGEFLRRDH